MKDSASTSSTNAQLFVSRGVLAAMQQAARLAHPQEACGILLGEGTHITQFQSAPNVHHLPETHFEIDPQALIDAHRGARNGGPQVLGYFHSHPNGSPCPSRTDRRQSAKDGKIWAIQGGDEILFWRDLDSGFSQAFYRLIGS